VKQDWQYPPTTDFHVIKGLVDE